MVGGRNIYGGIIGHRRGPCSTPYSHRLANLLHSQDCQMLREIVVALNCDWICPCTYARLVMGTREGSKPLHIYNTWWPSQWLTFVYVQQSTCPVNNHLLITNITSSYFTTWSNVVRNNIIMNVSTTDRLTLVNHQHNRPIFTSLNCTNSRSITRTHLWPPVHYKNIHRKFKVHQRTYLTKTRSITRTYTTNSKFIIEHILHSRVSS